MNEAFTETAGSGIDGKVVAITGASSGIGAAIAERLASSGATLVLGARRADKLDEVVERIRSRGGRASAVEIDVRRRDDLVRLVAAAQERHGRLDVLVANAGAMATSRFDELRQDDWDEVVATNLTGVLNGIAAALPLFRKQGFGQFVNMASTSAHAIVPTQGVYAATKTAIRVLSEALRKEAGPNLRVTVVSPGLTRTAGTLSGDEKMTAWVDAVAQPADAVARAVAFAIEQPAGVDVGEIIVRPTAQD